MKNTLIVPFDLSKINLAHFQMLRASIVLIILFLVISMLNKLIYFSIVDLLCKILLLVIILLLATLLYSYIFIKNKPAAILNTDGIWIKRHGLIPWKQISEFNIYHIPTTSIEVIGINLVSTQRIYKQSSIDGKCSFFWAKIFDYEYHITLSCLETPNETIIRFANQFIKANT